LIEQLSPRTPITVRVDGITVVLTIGSRSVSLDYDTANRLAVLLRGHGREAKRNAGDLSLKVIGFANLTDANLDELKAQKRNIGTSIYPLRG
jgi:hypothetical protein